MFLWLLVWDLYIETLYELSEEVWEGGSDTKTQTQARDHQTRGCARLLATDNLIKNWMEDLKVENMTETWGPEIMQIEPTYPLVMLKSIMMMM